MDLDTMFKLDFIGFILIIFYLVIAFCLFLFLLKKERLLTTSIFIVSCFAFAVPLSFFLLNEFFNIVSIPPDTEVYSKIIIDFNNYFNYYSFGVAGFSVLNFLQFQLCFGKPTVFIVFNILYFQIAILYIFKAFKIYCKFNNRIIGNKVFLILQLVSIIYPVALIQTSSILREPMLLMMFSINIYFLAKFYFLGFKSYSLMIFFVILLFIIRPLTGICVFISYFICYVDIKKLLTIKNTLKFLLFTFLIVLITKQIIIGFYSVDFSIDWIAQYREKSTSRFGIEGYETLNWESSLNYFKNGLLLFFQYLLSPFPILVSHQVTLNKLIPMADALFIVFLLLVIGVYKIRFFKKWLIIFFIFIIIPAIFETNISGAYRHRMNGVLMLIPMAAYIISLMKLNKPLIK